jgi:zinc protease
MENNMQISRLTLALALALSTPQFVYAQTEAAASQTSQVSSAAAKAWGFDKSDIKPDPDIRFGVLPNGMKYAIRKNETPKQTAVVRLHINAGSTAEADDQRGLMHFLEHMAFNGSKNVPEGEMIKLLERKGLAFGADTNASTSFNEIMYKLDLPKVDDDMIDTAFMLMRETASELTLDPKAIERERGIIIGEMRSRDNFGLRQFEAQTRFLAPQSKWNNRLPIGTEAVIRTAPPERIRDLYERYYSPERATFVIVGDVDVDAMEKKIIAKFADWKGKKPVAGDPSKGNVDAKRPFATNAFIDPDVPTSVGISVMRPMDERPDTLAKRRSRLPISLAYAMFNRRLARLARQNDAPFTGAGAGSGNSYSAAEVASLSVTARDRDWKRGLTAAENELRRAIQFGFTESELKEQIANRRTALKNSADQAKTRDSGGLASSILGSLDDQIIIDTPANVLARFESSITTVTLDEINRSFKEVWDTPNKLITLAHNAPITDAEKQVAAVWTDSQKVAVTAPVVAESKAFAHNDFGPMGKVVADTRVADMDIRTVRFANNVMLNIKKTDFEKDLIRISIRIGGGSLEIPLDKDGLAAFMQSSFTSGGTTAHSLDDIQSIMAGKAVSGAIAAGSDAFEGYHATTPTDLETQFKLMAAMVTAPGYRPEAEARWKNIVGVFMAQVESQPASVASLKASRIVANGNPRYGLGDEAALKARSFAELKPIVEKAFAKGHIEIGIVGDIDEQKAIDIVAKTFGALPTRDAVRANYVAGQSVTFPKDRSTRTLYHTGKADQAVVQVYWPTTDGMNARHETTVSLLSEIMGLQATEILREKLGATYSPGTWASMSELYKGYGYMALSSTAEPGNMDLILTATDGIAKDLATKPISADLIKRARTPWLERISRNKRENGYWIGLIDEAQSLPKDLEDARKAQAILESITAKDLQDAAKRYLNAKAALRIKVVPKAKPKG